MTTSSSDNVRVTFLDAPGADGVLAAWASLFESDPAAYALQDPTFVRAELERLPTSRHRAAIVSFHDGERTLGLGVLAPKILSTARVSGVGPAIPLHGYRLVGNRFLVSREGDDIARALVRKTANFVNESGAQFLLIEDIDRRSALHAEMVALSSEGFETFTPDPFQPHLRISLPATADAYWAKFSGKTKSTFRRKLKKFGESKLVRISTPEEVAEFLERAHAISKETWQSRHLGLRIKNDDNERALFRILAERKLLRSYLWFVEGKPAAFLVGNQYKGTFNYEEVGYAGAFARNSPGQMLLLQVLDDLFAHDKPDVFDFGFGDAEYKRLFSNDASESGVVWLIPPRLSMRATMLVLRSILRVKRIARDAVKRAGLESRFRQWVRYGGKKDAPAEGPADSPGATEKDGGSGQSKRESAVESTNDE